MNTRPLSRSFFFYGLVSLLLSLLSGHAVYAAEPAMTHIEAGVYSLTKIKEGPSNVADRYQDLDQDGVKDALDHCPNTTPEQSVDAFGCEPDTDKDGVFDRLDQCPETPKTIAVNFLGCEGDEDIDGVLDSKDRCPGTPLGTKVNAYGCKLETDDDQDGVQNNKDQCPNTPANAIVNQYGCPPEEVVITNIIFNTGSYEIRADQKAILDKDISRLRDVSAEEVVIITGYTDDRCSEESNMKLSWNRANSTKDYFVKTFNYNPNQILILGRGESDPMTTNATPEGRQANRRITFSIMDKRIIPKDVRLNIPNEMKHYNRYQNRP